MKPLLLVQSTPFCRLVREKLRRDEKLASKFRFADVEVSTFRVGEQLVRDLRNEPLLLVWHDGTSHFYSNLLNVPKSLKLIFDAHIDTKSISDQTFLSPENHNAYSKHEGVSVRVCIRVNRRNEPLYAMFDESSGNGILHISTDLCIVRDFPALHWIRTGYLSVDQLREQIRTASARSQRLLRFDIGGFSEMTNNTDPEFVYATYYRPLLEEAVSAFERTQ